MNFDLISAIIFYLLIVIIFIWKRKKVKVIEKIVFGFTTKRFNKFLESIGKYRKFWKIIGDIAIIIDFIFMGFVIYELSLIAYKNIIGIHIPGAAIVIPGVKIPGSPIFIPFWYGIISIFILALVHEFSHAIMSFAEKIKVKMVGFGFFLIFPIAFVEPSKKKFEKAKPLSRMRIAAMGPFANIVLAFLVIGLLVLTSGFYLKYSQIQIVGFSKDSPAKMAGIKNGEILNEIDGYKIVNMKDIILSMENVKPGEIVNVTTNLGEYQINTTEMDGRAYMGVYLKQVYKNKIADIYVNFFSWLGNLNFAIGIINLLPIYILDGGLMLYDALYYISKKKRDIIFKTISNIFLLLLVFDILITYIPI